MTPQRPLAFANYRAALDREEHAARAVIAIDQDDVAPKPAFRQQDR
jgi:hypothetical protein